MLPRRHLLALFALPAAAQPPTLEWHNAQNFRIEGLGFKDRKSLTTASPSVPKASSATPSGTSAATAPA